MNMKSYKTLIRIGIGLCGLFALFIFIGWSVLGSLFYDKPLTPKDIIGFDLPISASDIKISDKAGSFGGDYYLAASMPEVDYKNLVKRLNLRFRPDLLTYWATALRAHDTPWWTVSEVNDANTFFGDSRDSAYIVTRYEDGKLFFKLHVY